LSCEAEKQVVTDSLVDSFVNQKEDIEKEINDKYQEE